MPLLMVPMARALRYSAVRIAILLVMVPQLLIDAVVWQHPRWLWPTADGNRALQAFGPFGRLYARLLVDVQGGAPLLPAIWIGAAMALGSAMIVRWATKEHGDVERVFTQPQSA